VSIARGAGEGPALLEMQTIATTAQQSDKREYRTREEENDWRTRDCIEKLRLAIGIADDITTCWMQK
jgi:TPP-dependent pyruvate/acetoin dehydrogenase alpha subunit